MAGFPKCASEHDQSQLRNFQLSLGNHVIMSAPAHKKTIMHQDITAHLPLMYLCMYIVMLKPYMCTIPGPAYVHYMYTPNVLLCEIETWGNTWHIHTHDKIQDVRFSAHRGKPPRGSLTAVYIASIEIALHAYAH